MNATPERCIPHHLAWDRKQMMRDVVRMLSERGALKLENAAAIARTYDLKQPEVEAEMMKHLSEGEGK